MLVAVAHRRSRKPEAKVGQLTDSEISTIPAVPEPKVDIAGTLLRLADAVGQFNDRAAHRERVIDRLHEENLLLRSGIREAILAPTVADLIRLFDGLREHGARLSAGGDPATGALLASFADDVSLALDRCGVEVVGVEPGSPFDPRQHTCSSIVDTDDALRDNTLAGVLSLAMRERAGGRIRRPARVQVYRHRAGHAPDPDRAAGQCPEPTTGPVEETA